jgi:hypothetical protein
MDRDTDLLANQQRSASRPYVIADLQVSVVQNDRPAIWRIQNKGSYAVHDLRLRFLNFKKYVGFGWMTNSTNPATIATSLDPGKSLDQDLRVIVPMFQTKIDGLVPQEGAEFTIVELEFQRDFDDKHYLYLEPFWIASSNGNPEPASRWDQGSGPSSKYCTTSSYALELTFGFYRRNPLPFPVELYNYHYLLENPAMKCLESSTTMHP